MVVIKLAAFSGEKPIISARLLPETAATAAADFRLDDGALTPCRKNAPAGATVAADARTIYRHGDQWLSWPDDVHAVAGPVAEDRLYFTGDGAPKMRLDGTVYPLALPAPTIKPTAALTGTGDGDTVTRNYAWTWVTQFGEESAPSPVSDGIDWKPGQTVTISGFQSPPPGRGITLQRIYRSQTGSAGTYLYLIDERAASSANYVDTKPADDFDEALPSSGWTPPPDDMRGLVSMANGMMAGFRGKEVWFSEPWRPHAWPDRYVMTVNTEIVGLASIGTVLVVMTKGSPYLMAGAHPDSIQSAKLEANFACINGRAIVDLGFAVCYPAEQGLVTVTADGAVKLATASLFSREDWLSFTPSNIVAAQHSGAYVMSYDTIDGNGARYAGSLLINVGAAEYLVRSNTVMSACWYDSDRSALYFTENGNGSVFRFDDPDMPVATGFWKSKEFWTTRPENFGAILVDVDQSRIKSDTAIAAELASIIENNETVLAAGFMDDGISDAAIGELTIGGDDLMRPPNYYSVTVTVFADGVAIRTFKPTGNVDRLPAKSKSRKWEIAVSSSVSVSQIIMAGTVDELRGQM